MSAEAPVIALRELRSQEFIGGAAIVAAHLRALGAECTFVSVTGDDEPAKMVTRALASQGVQARILKDPSRPTTFKIRYMVGNQKLLRVSRLEQSSVPRAIERELIQHIEELAGTVDGIVVSDFVYGVVTSRVLEATAAAAKRWNIPIFGDVQCSSQFGTCLKFQNFSLISPNEREARIALGDNDSGLEKLAMNLLSKTHCEGLLLTLGANGFIAYDNTGSSPVSESFPALDPNPLDVTGAGDALLSAVAIATAAGWPLMKAAALGTCVSALQVGRIGNTPIHADLVRKYIESEFGSYEVGHG
jgi:rfaE bifunctional protein kinase chain/domain